MHYTTVFAFVAHLSAVLANPVHMDLPREAAALEPRDCPPNTYLCRSENQNCANVCSYCGSYAGLDAIYRASDNTPLDTCPQGTVCDPRVDNLIGCWGPYPE